MTTSKAKKAAKKKQKVKKVLGNRSSTKASAANRTARGTLIGKVATQSTLWNSVPAIKNTGTDVMTAGAKIDADDKNIAQIELELSTARSGKEQDLVAFDSKFDIFVNTVEDNVTDPKQMQELAVDPLVGTKYPFAAPLGLTATSDPTLHDISVRVKKAPGMSRCLIEVSSDATMATGVKQFPGDGLRQTMGPFNPGTYYLHACHTRSSERSAFTDVVTIIVK